MGRKKVKASFEEFKYPGSLLVVDIEELICFYFNELIATGDRTSSTD